MASSSTPSPAEQEIEFYTYNQVLALSIFPSILAAHLPFSNGLYGRIRSPLNTLDRHCLFAASFVPPTPTAPLPEVFTVVFADRSRHEESQIWVYNSLVKEASERELSVAEHAQLAAHIKSAVLFIKDAEIPAAPGWPFSPTLRLACLHEKITSVLLEVFPDAIPYVSPWNLWNLPTTKQDEAAVVAGGEKKKKRRELPAGYQVGRVPADQLDIVMSTSTIPRQASTLLAQANTCILNAKGELAAWGYIGVDGSLATLYVIPEERGKGLATIVARRLLESLGEGGFGDLGYLGGALWVHADVKVGNVESEGVMKSLGGTVGWTSSYVRVDGEKI